MPRFNISITDEQGNLIGTTYCDYDPFKDPDAEGQESDSDIGLSITEVICGKLNPPEWAK